MPATAETDTRDRRGFGSPIDGANEGGWARGSPVTVTNRGVLRRAVQHMNMSAMGSYEYEGPEVRLVLACAPNAKLVVRC